MPALPPIDNDISRNQTYSRYTSSFGVSQVIIAAYALYTIGKPADAREINETMLALPGYVTKSKDHMDVVRQILRSNQSTFSRTEEGQWVLTAQGENNVVSNRAAFERQETHSDNQEGLTT